MNGSPQHADPPLSLERRPGSWAVCRLEPDAAVPDWAAGDAGAAPDGRSHGFLSITRTDRELSIVAAESLLPADTAAERGWAILRVGGTLNFSFVGILARLTDALAADRIPVFVVSTYDTDYLLVKHADSGRAMAALSRVATIIDSRGRTEGEQSEPGD